MLALPSNLQLKPNSTQYWDGLSGSSISLIISELANQLGRTLLVVTPDMHATNRLKYELGFYTKGFSNNIPLLTFPDWETLPYDHFSPHQDIISQRISTLFQLPSIQRGIIIVPISTLMHHICPREYIEACGFALQVGDSFNPDFMRKNLQQRGYHAVNQVFEHGEFCIRGSIFDLFPMGSDIPYRIDLFDDEVDSIRTFDPETQRTIEKVKSIDLLPAREFPLNDEAISLFRQQWRDEFAGNPTECPLYQDISKGICGAGIEYYLPLFFENTASLLDYLPATTTIIQYGQLNNGADNFWAEVKERFEQHAVDRTRPLLEPQKVFYRSEQTFQQMNQFAQIKIVSDSENNKAYHFNTQPAPDVSINHRLDNPLSNLQQFINEKPRRILLCAESAGRRESLLTLLSKQQITPKPFDHWQQFIDDDASLGITIAPLDEGLSLQDPDLHVIAESQLFGQQVLQRRRRKSRQQQPENMIRNLAELSIGAPVVHMDYGIGRYLGLDTMESGENATEYLSLEYAGGDKLFVPISSLHLISRYSGVDVEHAPLHRLGSKKWQAAKKKAAEKLQDVAAELLAIYAKRASRKGHQYNISNNDYQAFSADFPFEETPDQESAIDAVANDMKSDKPMDRLICGDVGFGKTEVAMRAAFIAVANNKQVSILVPTTLLAQQHFDSFKDRFANSPVSIEMISRFRTKKEQQTILQQLQQGKVDIIIGTHKLLQSDIQFERLGLLIIDEEHRFGVQQKEKIKRLRAEVDLLTLTATPIPRTLNMAMSGIRDLSIIATPPARRLSIKTFIHERKDSLIREAILREIMRGGQVYFLHNKVDTIENTARELEKLIPEARIAVGHGQMRERELESVMSDFYHQRYNVLVCTTIIETGIDIPTANTIVIDRADRFGLAQLHQLRGRVGRSHHQAYAYLLTPSRKVISKDAIKRLEAISSLEDLGAGFILATHDLEIRGAGEFLGEEQSGHIQAIGLSLYTELLDKAVKALQEGESFDLDKPLQHGAEIDLKISALIPDSYIKDVHMRLIFYKRIANSTKENDLDELQVEMIDRFGLLPQSLKNLFAITLLKLQAQQLGIKKIDAGPQKGKLIFEEKANIDPLAIVKLVQEQYNRYKLDGSKGLSFILKDPSPETRVDQVQELLLALTPNS